MDVRSRPRSLTPRRRWMGRRVADSRSEEARGATSGPAVKAPRSLRLVKTEAAAGAPRSLRLVKTEVAAEAPRSPGRVETEVRARSHRQGGPSEDRALYNCGCGYVFDAPVTTSVDCPHCGDAQAW